MTTLTIGARGSRLARVQAEMVAAALRGARGDRALDVRIVAISTTGDRVLGVALSKIGDKGLFVKEIEQALLKGEIDLAVHSAKDLPSQLPDGLALGAFMPRGNPRDALVLRAARSETGIAWPSDQRDWRLWLDRLLPPGAHVGTSSLRRICQLRALRPDLRISNVRGNVDTRLRKLADGQFDALVLAAAGLERLGFVNLDVAMDIEASAGVCHSPHAPAQASTSERRQLVLPLDLRSCTQTTVGMSDRLVVVLLPMSLMLPAVAQGALAIETRSDDAGICALLEPLNDAETQAAVLAERAFLRRLEGGCQVPIAAFAQIVDRRLHIAGLVGSVDGATIVRDECEGDTDTPEQLGVHLAERLLADGAQVVLDGQRRQPPRPPPHPLEGMRVVVTRAEGRGDGLATRLRTLGAEPILYPVIAYAPPEDRAPMREALARLMEGAYDWLVLTSATAVRVIESWMDDNGRRELPAHVHIAAVGPATAEACVNRLHRQPVAVPEVFTAQHLADAMEDAAPAHGLRGQRVLLLNADIAKPGLEVGLSEAGADVDRVIAYRTVPTDSSDVDLRAMLVEGAVHAVTFTSGSTVRYFVERIGPDMLDAVRKLLIVCIGPATAAAAREIGLPPTAVAQVATEEGLVDALVAAKNERCRIHTPTSARAV